MLKYRQQATNVRVKFIQYIYDGNEKRIATYDKLEALGYRYFVFADKWDDFCAGKTDRTRKLIQWILAVSDWTSLIRGICFILFHNVSWLVPIISDFSYIAYKDRVPIVSWTVIITFMIQQFNSTCKLV